MPELQLGSSNHVTKQFAAANFSAPPAVVHHSVTFAGGCIATASFQAGGDTGQGGRLTTIVGAFIDGVQIAQSGAIDYDNVGHNSPGPNTLTIAVPVGTNGSFRVWGGKPTTLQVTLVRNVL